MWRMELGIRLVRVEGMMRRLVVAWLLHVKSGETGICINKFVIIKSNYSSYYATIFKIKC